MEKVTKSLQIPEKHVHSDTPTRAIQTIDNPVFLPLLGKLIDVVCNPDFVDDDFIGLRGSLKDALINCGRNSPGATIALIEKHRVDTDSSIRFCNYVIEDIKRNQHKNADQPKSISEVKLLLART